MNSTEQRFAILHDERLAAFDKAFQRRTACLLERDEMKHPHDAPDYRDGGRELAAIDDEMAELSRELDRLAWLIGFEAWCLDWHLESYVTDLDAKASRLFEQLAKYGHDYAGRLHELGRVVDAGDSQRARFELDHAYEIGAMFPTPPDVGQVVPWVQAALLQYSLFKRHWAQHNNGGGGEYGAHRDVFRYATAPDFVEYDGETVTACWYVDGHGPKYRGARDVSRMRFESTGHVVLADTNIVYPGQFEKMAPADCPDCGAQGVGSRHACPRYDGWRDE